MFKFIYLYVTRVHTYTCMHAHTRKHVAQKEDIRVPTLTSLWVVIQDKRALANLVCSERWILWLLPREGNAPGQPFLFHRLL